MLHLSPAVQHCRVDDDRTRRPELLVRSLRGTAVPICAPLAESKTRRIVFATVSVGIRRASDLSPSLGLARSALDSSPEFACLAACSWYVRCRSQRDQTCRPLVYALVCVVALSFAIDRLFTNKVQIRTLQMSYSLDGSTPWADDTQRDAQGKPPVLVFVRTSDGYCYDAVFYQPLIDKLKSTHPDEVQVQYNLFSDFGKERSYNIRSVAGVMLNDENHEIVQHDGYGGTIESPLQGAQKSVPAQCPR